MYIVLLLQSRFSSQEQFRVLHERYPLMTNPTKGLLLSTYLKMLLSDASNSGLQGDVVTVFTKCSHQMDPDLQQRSAEYLVRLL
jgi:AP-2 complex subunit alpha